jgi:hypothetical protein
LTLPGFTLNNKEQSRKRRKIGQSKATKRQDPQLGTPISALGFLPLKTFNSLDFCEFVGFFTDSGSTTE